MWKFALLFTSFLCIISLMRLYRFNTCLDHWWDLSSFAFAMALLLSQYYCMWSTISGTTPSSFMNIMIHIATLCYFWSIHVLGFYYWINGCFTFGTFPTYRLRVNQFLHMKSSQDFIYVNWDELSNLLDLPL